MLCDACRPVIGDEDVNELRGGRGVEDGCKGGIGFILALGF